ncbi:unnamed protein product [Sympodiomycopsis kandeliae]
MTSNRKKKTKVPSVKQYTRTASTSATATSQVPQETDKDAGQPTHHDDQAVSSTKRKRSMDDEGSKTISSDSELDENDDSTWKSKAVTKLSQMPRDMVKYWYSRHRLFTQYDSGILLDLESWYSLTPEAIASRTAARCSSNVVLDLFAGCGGNSIQFASTCSKVISIEIDPVKVKMAKHNARIYGVEDKITFLTGDGIQFLDDWIKCNKHSNSTTLSEDKWQGQEKVPQIDVIFLSPPWGGVSYMGVNKDENAAADESISNLLPTSFSTTQDAFQNNQPQYAYYPLSSLTPLSGQELYALTRQITPNIVMYLPRSCDLKEIAQLNGKENTVDVEEQWLGDSFKALCVYFGHKLVDQWREPV